ncbi:hypothetical protein INT43_005292 [Umbelopsis isabellina]|uniref:Uncharacterized protein n=1 Tax=Mortierella isabellina TaxID=91625 RepID=A0A8H7U9Z5_MORIS|nr:hypothetical protein INT43_005292 [Umbelopsis isabellina]
MVDLEFTEVIVSQDTELPRKVHTLRQGEQTLDYFEKLVLLRTRIQHQIPIIALERLDDKKAPMRCQTHITIGSAVPLGANDNC